MMDFLGDLYFLYISPIFYETNVTLTKRNLFFKVSLQKTWKIQGGTKVGLQLCVCKTESLLLNYYSLITVFFSVQTTVNLPLPLPVEGMEKERHHNPLP